MILRLTIFLLLFTASVRAEFVPAGFMARERLSHQATRLLDGRVFITDNSREFELYDPITRTFTMTQGVLPSRQDFHVPALLEDGRVLISGGGFVSDGTGDAFGVYGGRQVTIFDPSTETFTDGGSLLERRGQHTATRLLDGRVLIAGGAVMSVGGFHISTAALATAEVYDPRSGISESLGRMRAERVGHTATLLEDGTVLIVGGGADPVAELFDPATKTFSAAGPLAEARAGHTATRLHNGRVLIAGGFDQGMGTPLESVEIYDPATRTFALARPMPAGRTGHAAALLRSGRILIVGGAAGAAMPERDLRSAVVYDPVTERSTEVGPMLAETIGATATTLQSGMVLVTSGRMPQLFIEPASRRRVMQR